MIRRFAYSILFLPALAATSVTPGLFGIGAQDPSQVQQEEATDYYKKWLDEDALYIISDEERGIFLNLTTNDERDAFIEQFWRRRDPDPETSYNEFREEHYRRIAYANDHYSIGVPGWKSDRGRVYIINGPPDSIEYHDQGEQYYRPTNMGGGNTTTFAWELWYYRYIEDIGDGLEIEFVDRTMSGHFELARNELDKEAMLWVPGLGLTEAERLGGERRAERIGTASMANFASRRVGNVLRTFSQKDELFERMRRYTMIQAAPEIKFKDLEGIIDVQVYYNNLPFSVRHDLIRVTSEDYLVPVTFFFNTEEFSFKQSKSGTIEQAYLNVYGRVETMTRQKVYAFDDEVTLSRPVGQEVGASNSVYQRGIPLKPGRYKLVAVVRETFGGKIGTLERGLVIPSEKPESLELSPIILADRVQPAKTGEFITDPFVLGSVKVYPSPDNQFERGSPLGFYFEIYNVMADQQTLEPSLDFSMKIRNRDQEIPLPFQNLEQLLHRYSDRFFAGSMLGTQALEPGDYTLTISITDKIAGTTTEKTARFKIV